MNYETKAINMLSADQAINEIKEADTSGLKPWKNGMLIFFPAVDEFKEFWVNVVFAGDALVSMLPDSCDNAVVCTTWVFDCGFGFQDCDESILYINNTKMGVKGYITDLIKKVVTDLEISTKQVAQMKLVKLFEV